MHFGKLRKLEASQSLFEVSDTGVLIYTRYSRQHSGGKTFYGLRKDDLRLLEGRKAVIAFLWDNQDEPLLLPYEEFEDIFFEAEPAADGQYKVQILRRSQGTELYLARMGRYNVEAYFGWDVLRRLLPYADTKLPDLTHSQLQTLLGAIGKAKELDVWIPPHDRGGLDWSLTQPFECRPVLPAGFDTVSSILQEIDVVWIHRGSNTLEALYEVEYSTPIYSELLRFNDILLTAPGINRFVVVAEDKRRGLFARQTRRPTFRASGLSDLCGFMGYDDVYMWHRRIHGG